MKILNQIKFIVLLIVAACLSGCHPSDNASLKASHFEELFKRGDEAGAREIGRTISKEISAGNDSILSPKELCSMALGYMMMNDRGDTALQDEDISIAKTLYKQALKLSADSVNAFGNQLVNEEAGAWMLLVQLNGMEGLQIRIEEFADDSIQWLTDSISHEN